MRIWVFSLMHNEARMLPFFLRHYLPLAERVTIYDDHSDDGTPDLASAAGAVVRPYPGPAGLDDIAFSDFASEAYREARGQADWVIWVDADEFIYHRYLPATLARYKAEGVTAPLVDGYAMFAPDFPTGPGQIYELVRTGVPYAPEGKPCVIRPEVDIRWGAGKHQFERGAETLVRSQAAEIKLLHYRHLGRDHFDGRNARNGARISERNRQFQLGWQVYPENHARAGWHTQGTMFVDAKEVV